MYFFSSLRCTLACCGFGTALLTGCAAQRQITRLIPVSTKSESVEAGDSRTASAPVSTKQQTMAARDEHAESPPTETRSDSQELAADPLLFTISKEPIQLVAGEEDLLVPPPVANAVPEEETVLEPEPEMLSVSGSRTEGFTLAELEQLALEHNPSIRGTSAQAHRASGVRSQVGRYPNPTVGYSASQLADRHTDQHGVLIEQEFVFGDKLQLNERVLDQEVQAQLWTVESQRFRVKTDVRMRFYEVLAAQRRIALTNEFHEVSSKGVDIAKRRVEALEAAQPDVLQAEIQLNEVDLTRQRAQFERDGSWHQLAATVGLPELVYVPVVGELRPDDLHRDWHNVYQGLLVNSPELRAAQARVAKAQANIERQQAQPIPNLQVQFVGGVDNGTDSGFMNLQVGAPLPIFNKNTGNINAAYAEMCQASFEVERIQMNLKARLAQTSQAFDSAAVSVQRYEEKILPKAKRMLGLSEQAYEAGELNFLQVLIIRRTYFESNLQYVSALLEIAKANAQVEGLLLTGGLDAIPVEVMGDGLRGQAFSQQ